MIGLGLILLSILVFMVAPEISIYAWIFGMAFSIVGLFFKPRWMAVIGSIISSIPLLIFLLVVLILNNPGPPSAEDLQRSREVREGVTEEVFDDDVVVDEDSLLLNPIEVDEIGANGPTQQQ